MRSKSDGTLSDLNLVGSITCWKRKQSRMHSINFVDMCASSVAEVMSTQLISLMLKSPTISKWLGFLLHTCFNSSKHFSLLSS